MILGGEKTSLFRREVFLFFHKGWGRVETNFKNMHPSLATLNYSCFEILVKDICCRVCNTYIRGNDFNKESRELDAPSFCSFFFSFFLFFLGSIASLVFNLFFILNFPFLHIVHYHLSLVTLCAEKYKIQNTKGPQFMTF